LLELETAALLTSRLLTSLAELLLPLLALLSLRAELAGLGVARACWALGEGDETFAAVAAGDEDSASMATLEPYSIRIRMRSFRVWTLSNRDRSGRARVGGPLSRGRRREGDFGAAETRRGPVRDRRG
jgi:hypothetical protein